MKLEYLLYSKNFVEVKFVVRTFPCKLQKKIIFYKYVQGRKRYRQNQCSVDIPSYLKEKNKEKLRILVFRDSYNVDKNYKYSYHEYANINFEMNNNQLNN